MEPIARQLGLGRSTLYRHFPRRDVLIGRLLDEAARRMCSRFDEITRSVGDAMVVRALAACTAEAVREARERRATTGCNSLHYPCCLAHIQCPFPGYDCLAADVTAALERARAGGRLDPQWWDPPTMGQLIRALFRDLIALAPTLDAAEFDRRCELATQTFERALNPSPSDTPGV
jgi:AcrR family transcriptional regulator